MIDIFPPFPDLPDTPYEDSPWISPTGSTIRNDLFTHVHMQEYATEYAQLVLEAHINKPANSKAPLEILKAGRALIATPGQWTTYEYALAATGQIVPTNSPEAVRFSSTGALPRASNGQNASDILCAMEWLETECGNLSVERFNERNVHMIVIAMWDRTIAKLETQIV